MKKTTLLAVFAVLLIGFSTSAFAVSIGTATTVAANANIFGAISLTGAGDGTGSAPTEITGISGGTAYNVTNVTGSVSWGQGSNLADGGIYGQLPGATAISAPGNGISGISFSPDYDFLVGVFINSSAPPTTGAGPTSLNYGTGGPNGTTSNATDVPTFSPALNQVFFIGDGEEGYNGVCQGATVSGMACTSGLVQQFFAPTGANELFLGFANSLGGTNGPGSYVGDTGSLTATVTLASSTVPEPGTMLLMGLGLASCALMRKKLA
jgi:hypothetical protein